MPTNKNDANKKRKLEDDHQNNTAALFEGDELWHSSWKEGQGEVTLKKRMNNGTAQLVLYSSWFCPFAQRAWIAAEEAGVDYQWVEINPYEVNPDRPGGYTKQALPLEKKAERNPEFVQASPRGLVPAIRHNNDNSSDEIVLWESMPVAEYIDATFGEGQLLNRKIAYEDFSLVDVALAPFYQRFWPVGGHYFNLTFPMEEPEFQRLDTWWQAVKTRPSVAATLVCEPRLVSSYKDYATNVATSDAARNYIK